MSGGWQGSTRKATLPANWGSLVRQIKVRAGGRCERVKTSSGRRCPNPGTDCDHIVRPADGGSEDLLNLQLLCFFHHREKTSKEGQQARAESQARTQRDKPKHPGLR